MKFKLITRDNHHQLSEPQTYWGTTKRALLILLVPTQKPAQAWKNCNKARQTRA
jgi:hypothetical protein